MARTIEQLVNQYPNKTGAEILEIHKNELLEDKQREEKEKAHLQKIVDEIKESGAYYKGAFGTDQYFYYKVLDAEIVSDEITCKIEKIVLFNSLGVNSSCINKNSFSYEFDENDFVNYEDITFRTTPITEQDYNEVKDYLFGVVPKFFPEEWELRQKEFGEK